MEQNVHVSRVLALNWISIVRWEITFSSLEICAKMWAAIPGTRENASQIEAPLPASWAAPSILKGN